MTDTPLYKFPPRRVTPYHAAADIIRAAYRAFINTSPIVLSLALPLLSPAILHRQDSHGFYFDTRRRRYSPKLK